MKKKENKKSKKLVPGFKKVDKEIICHIDTIGMNDFMNVKAKKISEQVDRKIIGGIKKKALKVKSDHIILLSELAKLKIRQATDGLEPNIIIVKDKKLVKDIANEYDQVLEYKELKDNEVIFLVNKQEPKVIMPITKYYSFDPTFTITYDYNKKLMALGKLED